jgi:hypothetical protein
MLRRNTDGTYKKLRAAINDDINKFVELALGVVVAVR